MTSGPLVSLLLGLAFLIPATVQSQYKEVKSRELTDFRLLSSTLTDKTGEKLSMPDYQPDVYWFPVSVPSTVLTGLVANGIYPDPHLGMNNMLIPDASDSFNIEYDLGKYSYIPGTTNPWKRPYWYRTSFEIPARDGDRNFELVFKGINYRAAVWLNGTEVADSSQMAGMFEEFRYNVTGLIRPGEENALAVKIYPLDDPGLPATEQLEALGDFYFNGGPTGNIGKNVTMLCSVGWDWIPPVRDRNMGIWQPVILRTTGPVTITHPHVITGLSKLPDTTRAELAIMIPLTNGGSSTVKGNITVEIDPATFAGTSIRFSKEFTLDPGAAQTFEFDRHTVNELAIRDPKLWWPAGYGNQDLYRLQIIVSDENGVSDLYSSKFGIRTVSSSTVMVNKSLRRDFYVNGKKIFLLGGAWVPDMTAYRDSLRYDHELRLCRDANLNLIRIWGGGITPPDAFFDLCDRYGLLVWSDFWITGDTNGEFRGSRDWPIEGNVFISNMTSTILRLRNHPSLLVWTGGNEGHAREELYTAMRDSLIALDGTRPFISSSSGYAKLPQGWKESWPDNQPPGVYSGGSYAWQEPSKYFDLTNHAPGFVFKDEIGIPSQPPYSIMPRIVPDLVWDRDLPFPLNNTWGYHDAATGNGKYDRYYNEMVSRFGKPVSMKDFCDKMQLMNAMGYQGIFEAAEHKLNDAGGIMLWKLNAAFPSVVWQIYDWFLMPNAGYYFIRNSCKPVHIQFNRDDSTVVVINRTYNTLSDLKADIGIYSRDSESLYQKSSVLSPGGSSIREAGSLSGTLSGLRQNVFLLLELSDKDGIVISRNTYWLSPENDFRDLEDMPTATLDVKIQDVSREHSYVSRKIRFTNPGKNIAFFINPRLTKDGEDILPAFWSANYFTLKPGESMDVTVDVPSGEDVTGYSVLQVEGWNVDSVRMALGQETNRHQDE